MPDARSIETYTGKMVEAIGQEAEKKKFGPAPPPPAAEKKDKPDDEKPEHATDQKPAEAVLNKDTRYAQNGHDYLAANAGGVANRDTSPSGIYRSFERGYLTAKMRTLCAKHTAFPGPGGWAANFNPGAKGAKGPARQRFPYSWEAHHMIPASAFYLADHRGKPAFDDRQMKLLKQAPYDVNHGHNIIMLPKLSWAVPVHQLLQHPSDHPEYTVKVIAWLQEIAQQLDKLKAKKMSHDALVANVFENLKLTEDKCWNHIVSISKSSVEAAVAGRVFDHDNVLYQAKTRPTKYEFGRLY